ncbi:MAG TPA: hypothetical protein VIJ65_10240 [Acidobacteriaceae bacterium]
MSTAATVPPQSSSSLLRHVPRLTKRARSLLTAINLHYAGVAALLVLVLYMGAHLLFISDALHASNADALEQQHARLMTAQLQAKPLRGIDSKLLKSTEDADGFYTDRLPYATSQVVAELGSLAQHSNVRLTHVQYSYIPVLSGNSALTEMHMDASVSGDYRPVIEFINSLERDRMFFLVNGINLTGQQTGMVNLRIRWTTYLRAPDAKEAGTELPAAGVVTAGNTGGNASGGAQ